MGTLGLIFTNKLTDYELTKINKRRQVKTKINEGILSDYEKQLFEKGWKIQAC